MEEHHEIMDQFLEHRQQNFVIDNMNAVAGCGGIGVADVVGSGGEILGVKYDEQLQAEEHDVGDDDELKYVKEVQQSEKQQTGGKDFGDYNSGNELAENEEATHKYKIGHGDDVAAVDMKDEKEIANVVNAFATSTNSNDEHNGINKTVEQLQQDIMENINNNPQNTNSPLSFEKTEEEEVEQGKIFSANGDEEDISSLASNGTSSLSENVAQHFVSEMENAKESVLNDWVILGDMDLQLQSNATVEATHCQLNPEAKEFVPHFGSNPASPLSPHPNDIQSSNFDGTDFFGQAPSAVPRRLLDDDDFVAHSPRKGRCGDMDVISLPAEQEFDEEADRRPHELTQDEVLLSENNMQFDMPTTEASEGNGPIIQTNEDQGPETSVDPDEDITKEQEFEKMHVAENDVMKQSIYLASDEPIEDVLNSVQPIPTEFDSVNNSFMDDFTGNDIVGEKEQLQTEEKEHISNSPSTEEMQVELDHVQPSNSETLENLMIEGDHFNKASYEPLEDVQQEATGSSGENVSNICNDEHAKEMLIVESDQPCFEVREETMEADFNVDTNSSHIDEKHLMEETKEAPINAALEDCGLEEQMDKMSLKTEEECLQRDFEFSPDLLKENVHETAENLMLNNECKTMAYSEENQDHTSEVSIEENVVVAKEEPEPEKETPTEEKVVVAAEVSKGGEEMPIEENIVVATEEPLSETHSPMLAVTPEINEVEKLEHVEKCDNEQFKEEQPTCESESHSQSEDLAHVVNSSDMIKSMESVPMSPIEQLAAPTPSDIELKSEDLLQSEELASDNIPEERSPESHIDNIVSEKDDGTDLLAADHSLIQVTENDVTIDNNTTCEMKNESEISVGTMDDHSEVQVPEVDAVIDNNTTCEMKNESELSLSTHGAAADSLLDNSNSNTFETTMEQETVLCESNIESKAHETTDKDLSELQVKPQDTTEQISSPSESQTICQPDITASEACQPDITSSEAVNQPIPAVITLEEPVFKESADEIGTDVANTVAAVAEKSAPILTTTKTDDVKRTTAKTTSSAPKTKPSSAMTSLAKKTSTLKTTAVTSAKPKVAPSKPSSAPAVGEKKPLKMTAGSVASARKPPTTSASSINKVTTKTTSATSTVRSALSSTTAKTLTSKPATTTRTTTSTTSTARKPLSATTTTTSTARPRPASGTASAATKPTTLGVSATNAAAKPKVTSPRATLTSQLRKAAPTANTVGAKSPTKHTTTTSSVTKTTSSVAGARTKTASSTTTVTTTTKQFTARPAPKTTLSSAGSTSTTTRRLTVGGTSSATTTTQATSKTTTSATQRKSSPIKPVAGKTPTKTATSTVGAKTTTMKPSTKANTQKSAEPKLNSQTKPVTEVKELNGNASPVNDSAIETQQPSASEIAEPIVPNVSEPLTPGGGDGNIEQQIQVEMSSA
ncbi:microtubule-associated protein 205 [Musca autumnalis]|uniref:microtubule-associated protein 205 n=1 Tax=Musca autumnalis TaxID=221902 RepID=UPI003CEA78D1